MAIRPEVFETVRNKLDQLAKRMEIPVHTLVSKVGRTDTRLGIFLRSVIQKREVNDRMLFLLTRRYITYSVSEDMVPFLTAPRKGKKTFAVPIFLISSDHFGTSFLMFEKKDDELVLVSPKIDQVITEDEAGRILRRRLASMAAITGV